MNATDEAETALTEQIAAVALSDSAESTRANAFRCMRLGWNHWPADDERWWAVLTLIDPLELDHDLKNEGLAACATVVAGLGHAFQDGVPCADRERYLQLEAAATTLVSVIARIRLEQYRDGLEA